MFRAIKNAIRDMDKVLLFITIALCVFGAVNITTASSREAVMNLDESVYHYFFRHGFSIVLGLVAAVFVLAVPTKSYHYLAGLALIVFIVLNIFAIIQGVATRGSMGWVRIPGISFFNLQPAEVSKPIYVIALAVFIERYGKLFRRPKARHWNIIGVLCLIGLVLPGIVLFQNDLGTAVIMLGAFVVIFLLSPILKRMKFQTVGVVVGLAAVCLLGLYAVRGQILSDYQKDRLDYKDPCDRYAGTGYQICNAYIAMNLGGVGGVGIGMSTQKYSYIPEPHTDMVFAILAEEYGYIVCVVILILYMVLLWRIMMLASKANTIRGKYICLGIGTIIFLHIFFNLGGLFALIPLTGVPLPFLSYGGSHMLSLFIMLAIVQRIHIETKRHRIKF